jgi:hypothetical protein
MPATGATSLQEMQGIECHICGRLVVATNQALICRTCEVYWDREELEEFG